MKGFIPAESSPESSQGRALAAFGLPISKTRIGQAGSTFS